MIKPLKIERVYPKPEILLLKEMVTDKEIDKIKELATPEVSFFVMKV